MRILIQLTVGAVCIIALMVPGAISDELSDKEEYPEFTLRGTQVRPFHSDRVGEDYKLHIALPGGYTKSTDTYPVLYLTDSDAFFACVRASMRSLQYQKSIPPMIIVGIGYKETGKVAWQNRARDHLPAQHDDIAGSGGADKFVAFLQEELIPYIESNFRTDPRDRVFAGMSSGGTLGAYILRTTPELFNRYLIVSPALHTGNEMILELELPPNNRNSPMPSAVYTALGEHEADFMHEGYDSLVDLLLNSGFDGMRLTSEIIGGGTHMDAVYSAYVRGLKAVFDGWSGRDEKIVGKNAP